MQHRVIRNQVALENKFHARAEVYICVCVRARVRERREREREREDGNSIMEVQDVAL